MRRCFGKIISELAKKDDKIVLIVGDIGYGIFDDFRKENEALIVIGTGGDCFFFEKELKNSIFADPFLVLKGLNEILDYNE